MVDDVDVARVFDDLRGTTSPLVTRPGVSLVVEPPEVPDGFRSDPDLLRHVLRNLLSNAAEVHRVGDRHDGGQVGARRRHVPVADTGVGIAAEDLPRVFEEFYQVRGRLQTAVAGPGLGLPFARRVCRILGGDLRLESTPGAGTTFTFELPLAGPTAPEGSRPA